MMVHQADRATPGTSRHPFEEGSVGGVLEDPASERLEKALLLLRLHPIQGARWHPEGKRQAHSDAPAS